MFKIVGWMLLTKPESLNKEKFKSLNSSDQDQLETDIT